MYVPVYVNVITEPTVYTNSKFGDGYGPIVYSNLQCEGWEKGIIECPKYEYLQFTCSRSSVSGVLCHDGGLLHVVSFSMCDHSSGVILSYRLHQWRCSSHWW